MLLEKGSVENGDVKVKGSEKVSARLCVCNVCMEIKRDIMIKHKVEVAGVNAG